MLRSAARQLAARTAAALGTAPPSSGVWAAAFHTRAALLASVQVKIPALGESISDGTVAVVLKQPGDKVEEDEPILQIETDKVTVDVRAPQAGVIEAILVKPDDNVEVGHVVASIGDSAAAAQPASQPAAAQQPQKEAAAAAPTQPPAKAAKQKGRKGATGQKAAEQPQQAQAQAQAPTQGGQGASAAHAPESHRAPSIRFPPRRTAEGQLISALPREEAERLLGEMLGGGEGEAEAAQQAQQEAPFSADEFKHMIAVPIVGGSMPTLRGPPVPSGPPGPPRRTLTDREMEAIMLGGADP